MFKCIFNKIITAEFFFGLCANLVAICAAYPDERLKGFWHEAFELITKVYNKEIYYKTRAVRGPINNIKQSKCSIAGKYCLSIGRAFSRMVANDTALVSHRTSVI